MLQLVSHILAATPLGDDEAVRRFLALGEAFGRLGAKIGVDQFDEVALLTTSSASADAVARQVVTAQTQLREAKPRPSAAIAFSLATGLALAGDRRSGDQLASSATLQAMQAAQAVMAAQMAMIAAVAASSAAASSSC
jgi:hypothetical protein